MKRPPLHVPTAVLVKSGKRFLRWLHALADDTKVTRRRRGLSLADAAATFACMLAAPGGAAVAPRWSLDAMNAPAAWALSTGAGVSVAVVDTGVEAYHPAFGGRVAGGWGFDGTTD